MKRRAQLRTNPDTTRAWRQRSQQRARTRPRKRRRNDSTWHNDVIALRGNHCRACGRPDPQTDHLIARSQGGPSVTANGLPLCGPFAGGCHDAKTAGRLKIRREWLDPDQITWLQEAGHAWWLDDGTVAGAHCGLFAPTERNAA